MSNSSLHTKYRPSKWSEVVGQDEVVESLKRVSKDKRAHTFIFSGPSGTGKTTLARILGKAFIGPDATAANFEEVDAATNTGVEAVRAIATRAHFRAVGVSPVKVIIIDEAHRLSGAAWDSVLKATEEPPAHVYWMFCTTVEGKIPKTIQTRCIAYQLKLLKEEQILEVLARVVEKEKLEVSDEVLEVVAENAGGSPRQALAYLEKVLYAEDGNDARKMLRAAVATKEVIDFCRFLIAGRGGWLDAMKIVKPLLETTDAESIRIVVSNYFASALLNTKSDKEALRLLVVLEAFDTPYNQTDKAAPLLLSVGQALGIGQ